MAIDGSRSDIRKSFHFGHWLPADSQTLTKGDAVYLNEADRLGPAALDRSTQRRFVGILDAKWDAEAGYGSTGAHDAYTTPGNYPEAAKLRVLNQGVMNLPIATTYAASTLEVEAGAMVYLTDATQGAMLFSTIKPAAGAGVFPVGRLEMALPSVHTANDKRPVILMPTYRGSTEPDIDTYLCNHVLNGLSVAWDSTSLVSFAAGAVLVEGKRFSIGYGSASLGIICASVVTAARTILYYIGLGGTALLKDRGGSGPTYTLASAGTDSNSIPHNSKFWPTFTAEGVIFGAAVVRSASSILAAAKVKTVHRSARDIAFRRFILAGPIN